MRRVDTLADRCAADDATAVVSSGMRGVGLLGCLIVAACAPPVPPSPQRGCEEAVAADRDTAAAECLVGYVLTGDAATGGRAAQRMCRREGALPILEWIAGAIGDSPAGADAWHAVGIRRRLDGDLEGSLEAHLRAASHRAAGDELGHLHDSMGLFATYLVQSNYQAGAHQAAVLYELAPRIGGPDDRAIVYISIAGMMLELGSPIVAAELIDQAKPFVSVSSKYYGYLRQREAAIERARKHPQLEQRALHEAYDSAVRRHDRDLESNIRMNMVRAALDAGAVDDAARLLDSPPMAQDAPPNDRSVDAYFRGLVAIARGDSATAVRVIERVLPRAPDVWIDYLESVRGRALVQVGPAGEAEHALLHAVEATERKRAALDADTFKSWMLETERAPFEDLFLLYVAQGRLEDAFGIVQRATARSILDGLLGDEHPDQSPAQAIAAAGARVEGARALERSLRASHAALMPDPLVVLTRLRGNHVITYFAARGELWAIAVGSDGALSAHRIGAVSELGDRAAAWRRHPDDIRLADDLGERLLPDPLLPREGSRVFIVADLPIAEVAFAALRKHGDYVVFHHPVAYAPSAAVLSFTRRSNSPHRAVVLGDPTGDLPQARLEAQEVARLLHVDPRLGTAANRSAILDASEATLLHIAAHTEPTVTGSALRLADGQLDAAAIIDRGINAGAVVLLTCSSAAVAGADELSSLASAFLAAGAHTVIAARWGIEDAVGREFAELFYRAGGIASPVDAVASAQRSLLANHVSVTQWSAFVVMGGVP